MKTYSDLQDIDQSLTCRLELDVIGQPETSVIIGPHYAGGKLFQPVSFDVKLDLLTPFSVVIELKNKVYDPTAETAVVIKRLTIDDICIVPRFENLARYENDHNEGGPTSYLGFNGQWRLTFDRPFYQWLHQATAQGWLLS